MMNKFNQFHVVSQSPWPVLSSIQIQCVMISSIAMLSKKSSKKLMYMNMLILMLISSLWWSNTITEANKEGAHLTCIVKGMKISMLMFISSEVLFFTSFFWAYFHSGSSPNVEIGQMWPPKMVEPFNPINVPLLNTLILISSGFSITWAHHLLTENKLMKAKNMMLITCLLGVNFSFLQKMEYQQAQFTMGDSSYGTIFFVATGFHGIHVLIGTSFLMVNFLLMKNFLVNKNHHMGFELSAWYWHFVDVVWLVLYLSIYWWGK